MHKEDIAIYVKRYTERLNKLGYNPETLGWGGGKEKQFWRFKHLSEIGIEKNDSVLDLGCGFADLYEFLTQNGWKGKYTGIDINRSLLDIAEKLHPGIDVREVDVLTTEEKLKADWVVSSGVFNARIYYEDNLTHIKKMLTRMYEICEKGLAVDFLSTYVDFQHADAYHTSPCDIIDFGKKELKSPIQVRMDYLPYEFCAYFKKINYANDR